MSKYESTSLEALAGEYWKLKREEKNLKEETENLCKQIMYRMGEVGIGESDYVQFC